MQLKWNFSFAGSYRNIFLPSEEFVTNNVFHDRSKSKVLFRNTVHGYSDGEK